MLEKLNNKEMSLIKGGQNVEEYCGTVNMLIENNWESWTQEERVSAVNAWNSHCR
ncbi:MAG: hypothetical protein H6Q18_480 [Bacteroidetes bacterium]|nr:hypothetical protein [Bacteroidota bacterium]